MDFVFNNVCIRQRKLVPESNGILSDVFISEPMFSLIENALYIFATGT